MNNEVKPYSEKPDTKVWIELLVKNTAKMENVMFGEKICAGTS